MKPSIVVSGLKSNTHKGKGYNEFVLDDTAGEALVRGVAAAAARAAASVTRPASGGIEVLNAK